MRNNSTVFLISLILLVAQHWAISQESYTYMTDRRFTDPSDLIGYNFRPASMEVVGSKEQRFDAGTYSFGITQNNLYIKGQNIEGVYNLNNTNPTEYGFKLSFINARDALVQGHLKVIQNEKGYVEALVFKRTNKESEIVFHIPVAPDDLFKKEKAYFTDKNEVILSDVDSIWGKTIVPFHRIHLDQRGVQQRLVMNDSTMFTFTETITIIDKTKKPKKDKDVATEEVTTAAAPEALDSVVVSATQADSAKIENKNIKIIKKRFIEYKTINKFEDGTSEKEVKTLLVKNATIKEDKKAADTADDKYLITFETDKGDFSLYMNAKKAVTYFNFSEKTYLVRGY